MTAPEPSAAARGARPGDTGPAAGGDPGDPGDRWSVGDTGRIVVAAAVLAIAWLLAASGVPAWEADLFATLNAAPEWLYGPTWAVMQLGTVGLAAVAGVAVGFALRRPGLGVIFALTPILAWQAARFVKDVVERGRPAAEGLAVTFRGSIDDGYGFVSGHSAVAFSLATVLAPHLRGWWRAVPWVVAAAVGLARPYVGVHLPLDVVGGAALGIVVGEAVRAVEVAVGARRASHPGATATGSG